MHAVFFDFDSTIVTKESLDETIARALSAHPEHERIVKEIEAITNLGMEGRLAFTQSVSRRLAVLPLTRSDFETIGNELKAHVTEGMRELFAELLRQGIATYVVSGGFRESVSPTASLLGVPGERILTNVAVFDSSGIFLHPDEGSLLWTDGGKTAAIQAARARDGITYAVLVGDGANDLAAYTAGAVDHFVGFGANVVRESVRNVAPAWVLSSEELSRELLATLARWGGVAHSLES